MPVTRLRSGRHRDPAAQLLARQQASSGSSGRLTATTSARPTSPTSGGTARTGPTARVATGARIIRRAGGSARDVAVWRSLSLERRQRIKRRVDRKGGSLLKRVRRIRRRRARR